MLVVIAAPEKPISGIAARFSRRVLIPNHEHENQLDNRNNVTPDRNQQDILINGIDPVCPASQITPAFVTIMAPNFVIPHLHKS